MNPTKLLYMEDMQQLSCEARVERIDQTAGDNVVYLNQTVFYPQGGGQPYDTGTITTFDKTFVVEQVRFADGEVLHIGHFEGDKFIQDEGITCKVDADR